MGQSNLTQITSILLTTDLNFSFQNSNSKKQGVSGKSLDPGASLALQKVEKSARAKQLIRDALMDNDFLKNLSPGQVMINQG